MHLDRTDRCHRINDVSGACGTLDREDQLCCSAQGIAAIRHQQRTRVSTEAFNGEAITRRRSDVRDYADVHAVPLQQRSLLDMQLGPAMVVTARQRNVVQRAGVARAFTSIVKRNLILSLHSIGEIGVERARKQPAPQASDAEACRLF